MYWGFRYEDNVGKEKVSKSVFLFDFGVLMDYIVSLWKEGIGVLIGVFCIEHGMMRSRIGQNAL